MTFCGLIIRLVFVVLAYVEDSVDSASVATSQLDEPNSPAANSTKSVDELLQVFSTFVILPMFFMIKRTM